MIMKKFLIYISGVVTGIIAAILVAMLIYVANEPNSGLPGLTIFPEKGECIAKNEIEIFQVMTPNMALAKVRDGKLVLLINYDGKSYYDEQKIKIPANKCARQIGTYQYTTRRDRIERTVPAVVIE